MKRFTKFLVLLFILTTFNLVGCSSKNNKDIVILYTTDVHCEIEDNIGYEHLAAYKKEKAKDSYVGLVDAGDALSGDFIGAVSKGEYIIDIMNELDYDLFVLGNHDFDYGMDVLKTRIDQFSGDVLSCNFKYIGHKENKFTDIKDYKVIKYGKTRVGFVGVTTPYSIIASTPTYFMEDGEYAYSFGVESTEGFYNIIQENIDACYKEKADYVVLVSHLGYRDIYEPYSSSDVIANTTGVCAVLDGHAHLDLDTTKVKNKQGQDVLLCDAGYKMSNIGQLTIGQEGEVSLGLVSKITASDGEMEAYIAEVNQKVDELASRVLATSDITLKIKDDEGIRIVRSRETPIGNLVADSYRYFGDCDVAVVNGGGIRADLNEGELTYKAIMSIHPFGNALCVIEASGQQILDYLEFVNRKVQSEYKADGVAVGEFGGFASVSGLRFKVDTSIESSIVTDEYGVFISVGSNRRVKDVEVYENGEYVAINPNKTYTLASHNYLLLDGGDGANMFMNNTVLKKNIMLDYEVVVNYIVEVLEGHLADKYSSVEGRIVII